MPGGDRTGPLGVGPMTGRGLGYCGGFDAPGYAYTGPFFGRGFGFGRGRGRGMRRGMGFGLRWGVSVYPYPYVPPYSYENEAEMLRQQAKHLEDSLEQINKRLTQIEEQTVKDKSEKK
ncbi:MAG: DUF5320 domain-containing protein [Candidatus Aminicenantes bacterium]|nr:MAG: DUF5320 domain-containing protein [Candidatus Aminicenantes bacterium]